ncbi:hypothetical protein B566_EDAN011915, partial [Ephemera danica]
MRDVVEGYEDTGEGRRTPDFATHAMVVLARGIKHDWKQPLCYYLSAGPMKAKKLLPIIREVIGQVFNIGLIVLSRSTQAALKTAVRRKKMDRSALDTAEVPNEPNPLRCALADWNPQVERTLRHALEWLPTLKIADSGKTPPCFDGLIVSIKSTLQLWYDLKNDGAKFLLTSRLNQDPLENLFCILRQRSGNNNNPTAMQFRQNLQSVCVMSLMKPAKSANCEPDADSSLLSPGEAITTLEKFSNDETENVAVAAGNAESENTMAEITADINSEPPIEVLIEYDSDSEAEPTDTDDDEPDTENINFQHYIELYKKNKKQSSEISLEDCATSNVAGYLGGK